MKIFFVNKKLLKMKLQFGIIVFLFLVFSNFIYSQELLHISDNTIFYVSPNTIFKVNGSTKLETGSNFQLDNLSFVEITGDLTNSSGSFTTSSGTFILGGSFFNIGYFASGTGIFLLNGTSSQTFSSTTELIFYYLALNKTAGNLLFYSDIRIINFLRLLSSSYVDIRDNDLTIASGGGIFTDYSTGTDFNASKCISTSSGTATGSLIYEISAGTPTQKILNYPLGTPGVYTPAKITLNNTTFGSNASIGVKAVSIEHPKVETSNASLTKYWAISSNDISIPNNGADLLFTYDPSEVAGNEGSYLVLLFNPSYPNPAGYWFIEPGNSNQVLFNNSQFYSQELDSIDGDWTAGEEQAAKSIYFSRANGNYNDNTTWSKEGFGGAISPTIPNKQSDIVRISNNSVTITEPIAPVNLLSVEAGAELVFATNDYVSGDTMRVADDAKLIIGHQNGIFETANDGNIRTTVRDLSSNVIYEYSSTFSSCNTGDGLPGNIRSLILNKPPGTTLVLDEIVTINDSLVLNSGSFDINNYSINGTTSSRTMTIRDAELIVRSSFPVNYDPPTFTSGTITFDKSGANIYTTIPSNSSTPAAVAQYKNLKISGNRTGSSAITFPSVGEIKISGIFDISNLTFDTSIPRFNTDGSTVIFNMEGGIQNIPCSPGGTADSIINLEYYNLKIAGSGIKRLNSQHNPTFVVINDLTLESSTFSSNGFNLEVNQNWINTGGVFNPNTDAVILRSPVQILTNTITVRDTTDNPFYNLRIGGPGKVQPLDNMLIRNNLILESTADFSIPSSTTTLVKIDIDGNWYNYGGGFTPNSSTVTFTGSSSQTITKTNGSETFNYFVIDNNGNGVDATQVGPNADYGLIASVFDLSGGILKTRGRFAKVTNQIIRNGASPGHVDGALQKNVTANSATITYEVGYGNSYTPVTLEVNGSGGTAGFVSVLSDTITSSSSPISTNGSSLLPLGSNLDDNKNIRRQWVVAKPTDSNFDLDTRTFDITLNFIPGNSPGGDIRGGADTDLFDVRTLHNSNWIGPDRYGAPRTGDRTNSSTQFKLLSQFGSFTIGEPEHLSFYSISSGSWSDPNNWSTQHYFGDPANIAPTNDAYIYIGNSNTITIYSNKIVDGILTLDSLGSLMCYTNIISGSGTFTMDRNSTLGIGDANGITSLGASGNIQTSYRDYNLNNHNEGNFVYTDNINDQATGDGLPLTVKTLNIVKSSGSRLRLTNNITVTDSLAIFTGALYAREPATANARNITLNRNLYIGNSGTFTPYQGDVIFTSSNSQTVTAFNDLNFYDLTINNDGINNRIWFKPTPTSSHNITIENELAFTATNQAYIDLSSTFSSGAPLYNQGEWFMTIDQSGGYITKIGNGHISGELRKWVTTGDITEMMFEVGHDSIYSPYAFNLDNAGGTAGYIGVQVVPYFHPEGDFLDDANYNYQQERAVQKYWRVTRPSTSSFAQGTRDMGMRCRYRNPEDIPGGALELCFDLVYWMGGSNSNWQRLSPPNSGYAYAENNLNGSWLCGDRGIMFDEATYQPFGTDTSTTAYNIDGASIQLGNTDLGLSENNRFLLADVLVAQQGPDIVYYYSIADGNWADASTWSTVGYNSTVNSTNSWPKRRLDVARIGDGHTVTLNCNIGSGYPGAAGTDEFYEQRLGTIIVEETANGPGRLNLGTYTIRASVFELHSGGILSTGAEDGFHESLARGNLIRQMPGTNIARNLNYSDHNNGNFIFEAEGKISATWDNTSSVEGWDENYCRPLYGWIYWGTRAHIDDFRVSPGSSYDGGNTILENNNTGNQSYQYRYWVDKVLDVTSGNTYTARIYVNNHDGISNVRLWIDLNYDGDWDDPSERFPATQAHVNGLGYADITFTIPSNTPSGSTRMRVQLVRGNCQGPCFAGGGYTYEGEVEDYTVHITQSGYTLTQQTGAGLPEQVASITINTVNSSSTVTQTSGISVSDEFKIENGTFIPTTKPVNTTEIPDYLLIATNESYESLTNATSPSLDGGDANDGYYSNIPIGFDFSYMDQTYTTVGASTNGFLYFGSDNSVPANDLNSGGGATRPIIAPLWDDLDLSSGQFSYKTEGISPNRVFIAQWENVEWNSSAAGPVISFQVKLYEINGNIKFIYKTETNPVNSGSASIGLTEQSTGTGNFFSLTNSSSSPGFSFTTSTNNINSKPADGQVYLFRSPNNRLKLQGNFINNATSLSFGEGAQGGIEFNGNSDQNIQGTTSTEFFDVYLNNSGNSINLNVNAAINNELTFMSDNYLSLNSYTLTMRPNSLDISPYSGSFSADKMILSSNSGTINGGMIRKEFLSTSGNKSYYFPIGADSIFNPANIIIDGSYSGTPAFNLKLFSGLHPQRLRDEMLSKYWNLDLDGISNISSNSMTYTYANSDVNGNNARYIPSLYKTSGNWEIDVGTLPKAYPKPIEVTNTAYIEGDWTAGEADVFFDGRVFYSINSGSWTTSSNWSCDKILKHNGPPASYYPSELYLKDTVIIDGHIITYDLDSGTIDTMKVGGPNLGISTAGRGILDFVGTSTERKSLLVSRNVHLATDGRINSSSVVAGGRRDTLTINGNLINESDGSSGIDGGMFLNQGGNDYVILRFSGPNSSTITGEGNYGNPFAEVRLNKENGLEDTLTCMSNSFAAATGTVPYQFYFDKGILTLTQSSSSLSLPDATFTLSSGSQTVTMQPNSGINVLDGTVFSKTSLYSNINTTFNINGGTLQIGDDPDENFLYQTGTSIAVDNGLLDIAACFEKLSYKYIIDMSIGPNGIIRALRYGNTDIAKRGFNVSNESSTFTLDGGRIILVKSTNGGLPDYEVSAGYGSGNINGATLQLGDSILAYTNQTYKIAGTVPLYNLHSVSSNSKTKISQQDLHINNDWYIDENHEAFIEDNTIYLSGDLFCSGTFNSNSTASTTDVRQLVLSGSSNTQTIYNKNAPGIDFYNLRIAKNGGVVHLGTDNSNVFVRNVLEFSGTNSAYIDAATNSKTITMQPVGSGTTQILRNGLGHVWGELRQYFPTGDNTRFFVVGADTISSYRPVTISTVGTGGTAGYIGVFAHNNDHSDIANSNLQTTTNIQKYWTVVPASGFDLGGRTYNITTQFLNPSDIRSGADVTKFEHALYSPALPSPSPPSSWNVPTILDRTDSTITSTLMTIFGDYAVGEPFGVYYYSYNSGDWNDINSWSHDGYTTKTTPVTTLPGSGTNDYVYIGNGKTITIPAGGPYPTVKSIVIEKYNGLSGALYINGEFGYVKGDDFVLEDDCTLGMQNMSGIIETGNVGAVRMSTNPVFGVSRYVYNSIYGKQNTGKALPSTIKTLIVDNQSALPNNIVFISTFIGATDIYVNDTIQIDHGILNSGNRNLHLYGHMILDNDGEFEPLTADFSFESATFSPPSHTITLGNQAGAEFYNLNIYDSDVVVSTLSSLDLSNSHIYIRNTLTFDDPTHLKINVRENDRKVIIQSGASISRPQSTGYVDGILQKPLGSGSGSYLFEIGNGTAYTPATITFDAGAGGVAGQVDAVNLSPVPDEPLTGNRLDPNKRVPRYWSITVPTGSSFDLGSRVFNLNLQFPSSELTGIDISKAVVRRKSIPAETPLWSQRYGSDLNWNTGLASVELNPVPTQQWPGLGEFYIGEKIPRTFYSRQTGNWNDYLTWTFNSSHVGSPVPDGEFPNMDASELWDNVEIGLTHIVTLNVTESIIDTLKVKDDSKLDMLSNHINCQTCSNSGLFQLSENATISFADLSIPSSTTTMINFKDYIIGPNTTIEFYGTQTLPSNPFGLTQYDGNVLINLPGTKTINSPLIIQGNLTISNNAKLLITNIDAARVLSNVINNATLENQGVLEIGTP